MHASPRTLEPSLPAAGPSGDGHLAHGLSLWREAFMGLDWLALRCSGVFVGAGIPRGDGSGVVLVPGMLASNTSLIELSAWLRRMGYRPFYCDIERNVGCPEDIAACTARCIDDAYEATGMRVALVGHSLGGLIARGAAMLRPDKVSQVITLGTPVHGARVHPMVAFAGSFAQGRDCTPDCMWNLQQPLPSDIDEASVYTRGDGIVDWRTCRNGSRNIEVQGTHCGLVFNPSVYRAIASLLDGRRTARILRRKTGRAQVRRAPAAAAAALALAA